MKNFFTYFILLLFFANSYIASARNLKTNIDLLSELYFQLIQGMLYGEKIPDSSQIVIQPFESSASNWLIENEIIKWAKEVGFEKCVVGKSAEDDKSKLDYLLQYKILSLSVEYGDGLNSEEIGRTLKAEIYLRLLAPSRQVLFSGVRKKTLHDEILKKDIQHVENEKYLFTIGEKKQSFLSKALEPAIVSLVTGGIIYMFYSYRSQ